MEEIEKKTMMILSFPNKVMYHLPDWVYEQSRYLESKYERGKKYNVEKMFPNQLKFHNIELWKIMNSEKGIMVITMFQSLSSFLELWKILDFYEPIGTYIEPKRFVVKKPHPEFDQMLIGLQKFALSNQPYSKSMIDESIQHNDWRWLQWGLHYIDLHDLEPHDDISFQIAIDSKATECIDVIMNVECDYDNFEEFISNKYQIDIYEEMPASDLIALIHSK
jgi:hypothetical protein